MTTSKPKPKSGIPRTEVFALRLDPKLKYLAELAARRQRRSLANFVEWAIEAALDKVEVDHNNGPTIYDVSSRLWAIDESDRLIKLAQIFPELMSYEEQLIWRVICEHSVYNKTMNDFSMFKEHDDIAYGLVRDCWLQIKAYALGEGTVEELNSALLEHDDRIPF